MLALYLTQRVTKRVQKVVVGGYDRAIQIELDDSLRPADRLRLSHCIFKKILCFYVQT